MRVEDITAEKLLEATGPDLRNLHFRFVQIWKTKFDGTSAQRADFLRHGEIVSTLERGDFLDRYALLKKALKSKGIKAARDQSVDRALFKRSMQGLDVPAIGDVLLQDCFVSAVGQFLRGPRAADEIEILIKAGDGGRDEALEERVEETLRAATGKPSAFVYADHGAQEDHIPIFDLVLRARPETRRIEAQVAKADDGKDKIFKPFPNEHSARLQSPGKFDAFRRKRDGKILNRVTVPETVAVVWGHPKGAEDAVWIPEAIRFPKKGWTAAKAKKWLKDNEIKYKLFEEASAGPLSKFKLDKAFVDRPEIAVILSEPKYYENLERIHGGKLYNRHQLPGGVVLILADPIGMSGHSYNFEKGPIAIRFPAADWTEKTVKAWLEKNEVYYIRIERSKERMLKELEENFEQFEYLIHHVAIEESEEVIHHCFFYDHIGNMFEQSHLWIDKGKIYLDGKIIKEGHYHVIKGLEPTQEVSWSEEEARDAGIEPKKMITGMTLKEKSREW